MQTTLKPLTLKDVLARNIKLPVCPAVFSRLTVTLASPNSSGEDVAKIVSTDQSLTTEVLKVSNSAFYGLSRRVRSVDEAIVRLGFGEISAIVTAIQAREIFKGSDGRWTRYNTILFTHALSTAIIARSLGKRLNPAFADAFFTAGMMHDIGKLVMQQIDPQYSAFCQMGAVHGHMLVVREQDAYATNHAAIGSELLKHWNLPETLVKLVEGHHDRVNEADRVKGVREMLAAANDISHHVEAQSGDDLNFNVTLPDYLLLTTHLDLQSWSLVAADCHRQYQAMKASN